MAEPRYLVADGQIRPGLNLGTTIPARRLVQMGAADDQVVLAIDGLTPYLGVSLESIPANRTGDLQISGRVLIEAGGAIPKGSKVSADFLGRAVTPGPGQFKWGEAIYATSGAGQFVEVEIGGADVGFEPLVLTSHLTAWLRNSATSGAIASLPDIINVNPAAQATAGLRPTAQADLSISWDGADVLRWPITAENWAGGGTAWGIALWVSSSLSNVARQIARIRNAAGANAEAISVQVDSLERVNCDVYISDTAARRGTTSVIVGDAVPILLTVEVDLIGNPELGVAESDKLIITANEALQTLTFTNPVGSGSLPALLRSATGDMLLGANNLAATSSPFTGRWSRDMFIKVGKMPTAGRGVWTPEVRRAMRLQAPLV